MPSFGDLVPVAEESAFIFTGAIGRVGASTVPTLPTDAATVVVSVEDVIKAPPGLGSIVGREVTVQLRRPRAAGRFLFFADLWAVGEGIAVKERAHLDATEGAHAAAVEALERGYTEKIALRVREAFLVALGTLGTVLPLFPPEERRGRVPWARAPFEVERVLKYKGKLRHVTLVGPSRASKRMPQAPALRAGLRAILILQRPPEEAVDLVPEGERQTLAFIAATSDIQPPDRLATIEQIINGEE